MIKAFSHDRFLSFFILCIIIIGGLFVRLSGLSDFTFGEDELWHLAVANQDNLWDLIQYNFREEVHPPLSYIIWHFMLKISHNELWLRMSSIIPGILLVPSIYLFGRFYIGGKTSAYFLAFLFAFGAMPISITSVIRAYSPMMLALAWSAIFIHKYRFENSSKSRRDKYLIGYFLTSLISIELNHAAAFAIFSFGLILFFQALKEKNKRDFVIILLIHLTLGALVIGYVFLLKYFFNLGSVSPLFHDQSFSKYFSNYAELFMRFPIGTQMDDATARIINLFAFLSLIFTPILLIERRKWTLLNLVFVPLILISVADYFKVYPFTQMLRTNLFLFLSIAVIYAYFVQIIANFLARICRINWLSERICDRNLFLNFVQIISASVIIFLTINYLNQRNFFRNINPFCAEFSVAKSDQKNLLNQLSKRDLPNNIFVTLVRNIWYWRLQNGDVGHLKILTKNLGQFEIANRIFYFTAFPARESSVFSSLSEYQLFFSDLFAHLEKQGRLKQVKTFTFFDIGNNIDYLARHFHPQFILNQLEPFATSKEELEYKIWRQNYDFSWALNISDQVSNRFYFKDYKFSCGREIVIFSATPKFIRQEILNKNFLKNE